MPDVKPDQDVDVAAKENAAAHAATVFGWWRKDVPLEVSYRYWRDVHSVMVARTPGLYQYRLLHLAPVWALRSTTAETDSTLAEVDQPHGVAETLFLTKADQQTFGNSPLNTQYIFKDEQNLCDRNATLSAVGNNAHTFVDRLNDPTLNGEPHFPSFMLCFQQREAIDTAQFRQYLVEQLAEPWSQQPAVKRLRLHLLEPYRDQENSPCVSHDWAKEKHYQAWMELVVDRQDSLESLLQSNEQPQFIRAIHSFPIVAYYTLVYNGKVTEVGLRGYPAVQTILEAGAENQRQPDLLEALYGSR
ncbi:EthD domain-containing protein [Phormidium tenue FACHB-886]|nr:EthD domain-containing protein [Phormidium tenue FACHB-886]